MSAKVNGVQLETILRPIEADLARVGTRLEACLRDPIATMAVYMVAAGGKRLRPALVLLAGRSGEYRARRSELIEAAAAVELIHTATLIHDDIIDEAPTRRSQPTFHARFGTERAVLMGDYLYSLAFAMLAKLGDPELMRYTADVCRRMSQGEFQEVAGRFRLDTTEADYFGVIRDKTASLVAASCYLGARVAGAAPATCERLARFGLSFGMAFQIVDDCLDLVGDEPTVGKPLRSDLDKGSLSLPVIYLAQALSVRQRRTLFAPLRRGAAGQSFRSRIAGEALRAGAVSQAFGAAGRFLHEAAETVAERDGVMLTDTYRQLVNYALERVH
ncbi:MAG: polyprenyl synthetase family protein [Candidatus Omnitrophica bacterium]|nr:polyprenyl synthetase family protein [Candidatus Omnitrophota bacterium]